MFTELAIKRAIEGGWNPKAGSFYDTPWKKGMASRWLQIKPKRDEAVQRLSYSAGYGQGFGDGAIFLDKNFWQCLGKTEGWSNVSYTIPKFQKIMPERVGYRHETQNMEEWRFHQHSLLDHLAQDKSIEEFFKSLLKE